MQRFKWNKFVTLPEGICFSVFIQKWAPRLYRSKCGFTSVFSRFIFGHERYKPSNPRPFRLGHILMNCTLLLTLTGLRQRLPDPLPELPCDQRDLRRVSRTDLFCFSEQ